MCCCGCPEGCSVASLMIPFADMSVEHGPDVAPIHTHTHTQAFAHMSRRARTHTTRRTQNWQSPPPLPSPPVSPPVCPSAEERRQLFWLGASVSQVPSHILYKTSVSVSALCPTQQSAYYSL